MKTQIKLGLYISILLLTLVFTSIFLSELITCLSIDKSTSLQITSLYYSTITYLSIKLIISLFFVYVSFIITYNKIEDYRLSRNNEDEVISALKYMHYYIKSELEHKPIKNTTITVTKSPTEDLNEEFDNLRNSCVDIWQPVLDREEINKELKEVSKNLKDNNHGME